MHLVIIGFDEIVSNKYIDIVNSAIENGTIEGYLVFDLFSQKEEIEQRVEKLQVKPVSTIYLRDNCWKQEFEDKICVVCCEFDIKVYIATEAREHLYYLEWCVNNGVDVLVEKPIFVSMNEGVYDPDELLIDMQRVTKTAEKNKSNVSVMTLGRYHQIYNDIVLDDIRNIASEYNTPITSIHLRHSGGVWNIGDEYDTRDDHPYKYGYGMIMHGGYHYIDLVAQAIEINKLILNAELEIELIAFSARPSDQDMRIGKSIYAAIGSDPQVKLCQEKSCYGETDISATFRIRKKNDSNTITIGTISLEQTTQSIRNWPRIPYGLYNKNGRVSSVDFELQLSVLASEHVICYDVPAVINSNIDRIDARAEVLKRFNASILKDADYVEKQTFTGIFHSNSNKKLMSDWINDNEKRSNINQHHTVMKLVYLLSKASQSPGEVFRIDV